MFLVLLVTAAIPPTLLGSRPPARRSGVILAGRRTIDSLTALRAVYQAGALFTHVHSADAPHKLVAIGIVSMASACARACGTYTIYLAWLTILK